jgi:hypothetical protein
MKRFAVVALVVAFAGLGRAEDKEKGKADPTGTWKWTVEFGGQSREVTLKLKHEGDKLTGTITGRNNEETKIEDGTVKGDEVAFKVTREFNGQKFVMKYSGKVSGDTLKGKTEFERDGQTQSRDFEAKREKK